MDTRTVNTAFTLLDFYSAISLSKSPDDLENAMQSGVNSLGAIGAVLLNADADGTPEVNFTPLMFATGMSLEWLFDELSEATGKSTDDLAAELREHFTEMGVMYKALEDKLAEHGDDARDALIADDEALLDLVNRL